MVKSDEETTPVLHRVFDATTLPFGVDRPPLEEPALALTPSESIEGDQPERPPSSPRERFPTEYHQSEGGPSSTGSSGAVALSPSWDPPEIELTRAMIEAGGDALACYYGEAGEPEENLNRAAEAVFEAMIAARVQPPS